MAGGDMVAGYIAGKVGDRVLDWLRQMLEDARLRVPEGNEQDPDPRLGPRILQQAAYCGGAKPHQADLGILREMFCQLLAGSMDTQRVRAVHPSFATILSQLTRDEAHIIRELHRAGQQDLDEPLLIHVTWWRVGNRDGNIVGSWTLDDAHIEDPQRLIRHPDKGETYWTHLTSKSLVTTTSEDVVDSGEIKRDPISGAESLPPATAKRGQGILSDFGRQFATACVPPDDVIDLDF